MKINIFIAILIFISASNAYSNGVILNSSPTENGITNFISNYSQDLKSGFESIRLTNNGNTILLYVVDENQLFGYFYDGSNWILFIFDGIKPNTLQISVRKTNGISYRNKKDIEVNVDLNNPSPYK